MSEYYGLEAKQKAVEWGYDKDDIDAVNYATSSSRPAGCKWVWTSYEGNCVTCGDMDWTDKFEDD